MTPGRLLSWLCCLGCLSGAGLLAQEVQAPAGKPVHTFEDTWLWGVVFSPTDRGLVTWTWNVEDKPGRIVLWDLASGKEQRAFTGQNNAVHGAAFSPDGTRLAAITLDDPRVALYVWDVKSGRLLLRLEVEEGWGFFDALAFSPDGKSLLTGHNDSQVRIWDLEMKRVVAAHKCDANVNTVAFSSDGRFAAAGCRDGTVWVWEEGGKGKGRKLPAHAKEVKGVAFSPDSKTLVSGSEDGTFIVWNTADWKVAKAVQTGLRRIFCLTLSRDGKSLVVGGDIPDPPGIPPEKAISGCVEFYSTEKFDKIGMVGLHVYPVASLDLSRDGKFLATAAYVDPGKAKMAAKVWKMEDLPSRAKRK